MPRTAHELLPNPLPGVQMLDLLKMTLAPLVLIALLSGPAQAAVGGNSGGGGDTDASSFVTYMKQIAYWGTQHADAIAPGDAAEMSRIANLIDKAMDGSVKAPIYFSDEKILIDSFGTPKMGAFQSVGSVSVQISRPRWELLSIVSRYKLAALELFGLAHMEHRYSTAALVEANFMAIAGKYTYSNLEMQLLSSPVLRVLYGHKDNEWADGMFNFTTMTAYGGINLAGSVLHGYQRKLDSDLRDTADEFRVLPQQVLFDILVSGVARYTLQPKKNSWGFVEANGTTVPTERYARYLNSYVRQVGYLLKEYQEKTATSLSDPQKTELQNIAQMIEQAKQMVDASYEVPDHETKSGKATMIASKDPFTEYFDGAINKMRKSVVDGKCTVPSTYILEFNKNIVGPRVASGAALPAVNLDALKKVAFEKSNQLQNLLSTIDSRWKALVKSANLNAINIAYRHNENEANETTALMDISYMLASDLENSAQQDIEVIEDLMRATDADELCVKL